MVLGSGPYMGITDDYRYLCGHYSNGCYVETKKMTGTEYEKRVAAKMRWSWFWSVEHVGKSGDFGADIIARDFWMRKCVVQCKCYHKPVGVKAVQEVIAARQYYHASRAIVASNSTFTKAARQLASRCGVELWPRYK